MFQQVIDLINKNPVTEKLRDIRSAFLGMFWGLVLVILSFVVLVLSFTMVDNNSAKLALLEVREPREVNEDSEEIQITKGVPETDGIAFEYSLCGNIECDSAAEEEAEIDDLLYYRARYERYEVVKEEVDKTRKKTVDGKEVTESYTETEYNEEWVEKREKIDWAEWNLGDYRVEAEMLDNRFDTQNTTIDDVFIFGVNSVETYDQEVSSAVGDTRVIVEFLKPDEEMLVVGEVDGEEIVAGDVGIVTDMEKDELVEKLRTEERNTRLGIRVVAWIILFIGFYKLIAPIIEFVEIIPIFGKAAKSAAIFGAGALAAVTILAGYLLIEFWYVFVILTVLLVGFGIYYLPKVYKREAENAT